MNCSESSSKTGIAFFFDQHTAWYILLGRHAEKFFLNRPFIILVELHFSVSENVVILGKGLFFHDSG